MNKLLFQNLLRATVIGAVIILTANSGSADLASKAEKKLPKKNLVVLQFKIPKDPVPKTSVGAGVRGDVQFSVPKESSTPSTTVGAGVRGDVQFSVPKESSTPSTTVGAGVRGDVQFSVPKQSSTPSTTVGAGVRGDVQFSVPKQSSTPSTTVGAGVRGLEIPLTALLPTTKHGRTLSARPSIMAYLPPLGVQEVFFSIQDEEGNSLYYTILKVPPSGGIISFNLPKSAPELEVGTNYLWYFAPIEPSGILRPDNYAVTGWVTRIEADLKNPDLDSSPIKLATEYASAGIWYNTLEVLVNALHSDPKNTRFISEWYDLLEQVGLEQIASEPIVMIN
jgi:hypothetical protein